MPIFKLENTKLVIAQETNIKHEEILEDWFENSPWALIQDEHILWIGRQTSAQNEEGTIFPDLLGIDLEGNLVIVEFKRGRTRREVIAQLLEYAAWANELSEEQIQGIADAYFQTRTQFEENTFYKTFCDEFETDEVPQLNRRLRLFIVAGEIPARVSSVCRLLRSSYRMDIRCLSVSMFQTESEEVIIGVEDRLGDDVIDGPKPPIPKPRLNGLTKREVVWKVILELTEKNIKNEFTAREVITRVLASHSDFNENTIHGQIHLFRRSKLVVAEAIQELTDENTINEFPEVDEILKTVLHNHPRLNQIAIRHMVDIFRKSEYDVTQLNQTESVSQNPT